ncbi:hypothetical protein FQR65_LT00532 [Abscondita terminalis]|nr:hypothetical protein FQR65_LT00532 [Abscondita terminalis]
MEILFSVVSRLNGSKQYQNSNSVLGDEKPFKIKFLKNVKSAKNKDVIHKQVSSDITFENINFSVSLGFRKGMKKVLHQINGKFCSGNFVAIVGPSGAGKTTLLDILSGYQINGVNGTVYNNDYVRNVHEFRKFSSYITHENHLQSLLTVWENMTIAADLKLGLHISQENKDIMIKDILATLSLDTSANIQACYLSGGQQKRLAIAVELIDNPLVMFFDEPTTGLDSSSSGQCLRLLQKLSKEGKTIICTIHQASANTLQLFDEIYILGEGRCLYHGTAQNVLDFLNSINITCPMYNNPVDYVIELASSENKNDNISVMTNRIENGKCNKWIRPTKPSVSSLEEESSDAFASTYKRASLTHQFKILSARSLLNCKRNKKMLIMRIMANVIIASLYSILYWQIGDHGGKVRNNYNLLFCVLIHHMTTTMMLGILSISSEISTITNEYFNKRYSLKMYFAANTLCEMPILVLCCLIFTAIVYPATGQPIEIYRLIMFTIMSLLIVFVSQSLGFMVGTIFNLMNGTFVGFALSASLVLLAGMTGDLTTTNIIIYWIGRSCFTKYSLEGIVSSIYGYGRDILSCPEGSYCHYKYPKKFLKDVMIYQDEFWLNVIILCCNYFLFKLTAFLILKWRVARQKHR